MKYKVKATEKYRKNGIIDAERTEALKDEIGGRDYYPEEGEEWIVDEERKNALVEKELVVVVEEIAEKKQLKKEKRKVEDEIQD